MTIIKYTSPYTDFPVGTEVLPTDIYLAVDTTDVSAQNPVGKLKQYNVDQLAGYIRTNTPWTTVTSSPVNLLANQGFIANGTSLIIFTLPLIAKVGDQFLIEGRGTGLFQMAQNSGQKTIFGNVSTTTGTSGYLLSTDPGDSLWVMCTVANTEFKVRNTLGNFDYA